MCQNLREGGGEEREGGGRGGEGGEEWEGGGRGGKKNEEDRSIYKVVKILLMSLTGLWGRSTILNLGIGALGLSM